MTDIPNLNLQAMSVMSYAINNDAANIANANTPGYTARETVITSGEGRIQAVTEPIIPYSQNTPTIPFEAGGDNTPQREAQVYAVHSADIVRDMTNLNLHKKGFDVNAATARVVEQTTGTILSAWG